MFYAPADYKKADNSFTLDPTADWETTIKTIKAAPIQFLPRNSEQASERYRLSKCKAIALSIPAMIGGVALVAFAVFVVASMILFPPAAITFSALALPILNAIVFLTLAIQGIVFGSQGIHKLAIAKELEQLQ